MKKGNLWLPLVLFIAFSSQSANAVLIHFGDVPLGVYPVGGSFTSAGVEVTIEDIIYDGMTYTAAHSSVVDVNHAEILNPGMVGPGAGKELKMSNVLANFALDDSCSSCYISLFFAEFGNLVNLGINNSILTAADFTDLEGLTIGGALISVVIQTPDNQGAMLIINGNVETFQIGGENLYVDSIFIESIPEPTTIALLGLGGFGLLITRKKR